MLRLSSDSRFFASQAVRGAFSLPFLLGLLLIDAGCQQERGLQTNPDQARDSDRLPPDVKADRDEPMPRLSEVVKPMSSADPVEVRVTCPLVIKPGDQMVVTVAFDVSAGYELQSLRSQPPKQPTRVELKVPSGWVLAGDLKIPEPKRSTIPGNGLIYSGKFSFEQTIRLPADFAVTETHSVECVLSYQACDDRKCLRPVKEVLVVPVNVVAEN